MDKQKELKLFYEYKAGNPEAKKELLSSLDNLIMSQVSKYSNSGLPLPALQLEGKRLALHSLETYDPNKAQLNTHVVNNLKKLSRFVTTYQNVGYIPEPRALLIGQYQTVKANLEVDKGREPTTAEIADAMNISIKEVERLQNELRSDLSLTVKTDEDEGGFYRFVQPEFVDLELKEAIDAVYIDSDPIDKKILEYTLGLYGNPIKTAKEITLSLNLTDSELKRRKKELAKKIKELTK